MYYFVFDLDDTLYDQLEPFSRAFAKRFAQHMDKGISLNDLFKRNRYHADKVFEASAFGEMDMDDMYIYRMKYAMKDFGIDISDEEALGFQKDYKYYQGKITLPERIEKALDYCKNNDLFMGIITNGPSQHQRSKIEQLGLTRWIPANQMLVSGDYDFIKPSQEIFKTFEEKHGLNIEKTYYVGDSFANDIIGADRSGWKSIWMNHRKRERTDQTVYPDYTLKAEDSLVELIKEITA